MVVDRELITLDARSITLRWQESTPDPDTGETYPVLVISTPYLVDIDEEDYLSTLTDIHPGVVVFEHGIAFRPCATGRCLTSGPLVEAYRTVLTLEGRDAALPDLGLELIHQVRFVSSTVGANVPVGCPLTLLTGANPAGLTALLSIGVPPQAYDPITVTIGCFVIADVVAGLLNQKLADLAGTLDTIGDLFVNPPTFRTDLETVLVAGFDGVDETLRDGQMSVDETTAALTALGFGNPGTTAFGLFGLDDRELQPFNVISAQLLLTGSLAELDGQPADSAPDALGAVDGAFTDRTFDMFRRGTLEDVRPSSVRLDLTVLRGICESGDIPRNFVPICGVCTGAEPDPAFCEEGRIRDRVIDPMAALGSDPSSFTIPAGTIDPFTVPSVPGLARLIEVAPQFGQALRRLLLNSTGTDARFSEARFEAGAARFSYRIDPDLDGVDSSIDNCPLDFNPDQADTTEGLPEGVGDECDVCPEYPGGVGPAACSCDIDGDLCVNAPPFGPPLSCGLEVGRVYDRNPTLVGVADFDGDGAPDDCDADTDGDGVPDALDNCPRGDGRGGYVVGLDDNPDQTDSGGAAEFGDICDVLCSGPDESGCAPPVGGAGDRVPDGAFALPGYLPESGCFADGCGLGLLAICGGRSLADCAGLPFGFGLIDPIGQPLAQFGGQSGASIVRAGVGDLDGDGVSDLLLANPDAVGECTPNGCLPQVGDIALISGATGAHLERVSFGEPSSQFGAAVVTSGTLLSVGAPTATDPSGAVTGAVHVFDTASGSLVYVTSVYGRSAGDRFGEVLAPISTKRGRAQLLIGAPGAGEVTRWDPRRGSVARMNLGGIGELTTLLAVREDDRRHGHRGPVRVVVGVPEARAGSGAVVVFDGRGRRRATTYGRASERLGTAIVAGVGSPDRLFVGAPGYRHGRGAVVVMSLVGRRIEELVWYGRGLSSRLVQTGDVVGDEGDDLLVGFELDGVAATAVFGDLTRERPRHGPRWCWR